LAFSHGRSPVYSTTLKPTGFCNVKVEKKHGGDVSALLSEDRIDGNGPIDIFGKGPFDKCRYVGQRFPRRGKQPAIQINHIVKWGPFIGII
jgi:hypothetical protein